MVLFLTVTVPGNEPPESMWPLRRSSRDAAKPFWPSMSLP